jgi:hypothetical protein
MALAPGQVLAALKRRGNKYGAQRAEHRGVSYASKAEARHAAFLDLRIKAGEVQSWRPQVRFPLVVNGTKVGTYVADFEVLAGYGSESEGERWIEEVKGFETPVWKLKRKLMDALYPSVPIRVVKAR